MEKKQVCIYSGEIYDTIVYVSVSSLEEKKPHAL